MIQPIKCEKCGSYFTEYDDEVNHIMFNTTNHICTKCLIEESGFFYDLIAEPIIKATEAKKLRKKTLNDALVFFFGFFTVSVLAWILAFLCAFFNDSVHPILQLLIGLLGLLFLISGFFLPIFTIVGTIKGIIENLKDNREILSKYDINRTINLRNQYCEIHGMEETQQKEIWAKKLVLAIQEATQKIKKKYRVITNPFSSVFVNNQEYLTLCTLYKTTYHYDSLTRTETKTVVDGYTASYNSSSKEYNVTPKTHKEYISVPTGRTHCYNTLDYADYISLIFSFSKQTPHLLLIQKHSLFDDSWSSILFENDLLAYLDELSHILKSISKKYAMSWFFNNKIIQINDIDGFKGFYFSDEIKKTMKKTSFDEGLKKYIDSLTLQ
ncbi:MAG: hypothetical protein J5993_04045 [Clostridia bacterium]|nr:hypothetical protein [Clostridia bacterium]